jgi:hypothetical protein
MSRTNRRLPPYVSYKTFESFLDGLRASGVPNKIQRKSKIMASKSGSSQAALLSAIHYLRLIDEDEKSTPALEALAQSRGSKRQEFLRQMVVNAYSSVFQSTLNLERATTDELSELFEKEGVIGEDTLRKCVTFFCLAAKAGGIKLSSYIKPYAGRKRRLRGKGGQEVKEVDAFQMTDMDNDYGDWNSLLKKFPDFDPSWPEDRRNNWLSGFERLSRMCKVRNTNSTNGQP